MGMRAADSGVLNPLGAGGAPVKGVPAGVQGGRVRRGTQYRGVLDPQGAGGGPLKGVPLGAQGGRVGGMLGPEEHCARGALEGPRKGVSPGAQPR